MGPLALGSIQRQSGQTDHTTVHRDWVTTDASLGCQDASELGFLLICVNPSQ